MAWTGLPPQVAQRGCPDRPCAWLAAGWWRRSTSQRGGRTPAPSAARCRAGPRRRSQRWAIIAPYCSHIHIWSRPYPFSHTSKHTTTAAQLAIRASPSHAPTPSQPPTHTHLRLMALPNTVYSERRWLPTIAQNSWPVVTPQQARPPRRCTEGTWRMDVVRGCDFPCTYPGPHGGCPSPSPCHFKQQQQQQQR